MSKSHQKIIEAAFEILARDPSAPLENIADAADVSRMTIHRLFNNRETLIEAVYREFTKWGNDLVDQALAKHDDPLQQLEFIVKNGAVDGIRFHLLYQIRDRVNFYVEDEALPQSAKSLILKLKGIFNVLNETQIVKPNMTVEWLFYLYIAIMHCAWKVLKDGAVAAIDVPNFAWESFTQGVFVSNP